MEENTTTETTETVETNTETQTTETQTADTQTTETTETPAPPVVPEGYVSATEVETERTARTAAEEARTQAETARVAEAERASAAEARARAAEIREAARDLNFNDPSDAERFIAADATDFKAALTEVLKTKGYLAKQEAPAPVVTPTSPTNPARQETLTLDAIKGMTKEQIAANWKQVTSVLAAQR